MNSSHSQARYCASGAILILLLGALSPVQASVCDVKKFGASGQKSDDARPAIQRAIEACGKGGTVYFPPGQYTSGTLHLRSHMRLKFDADATLFADPDPGAYDCGTNISKAALLFGENLDDVSIQGPGIVDGQAQYEWRLDDFEHGFDHKTMMEKLGKSLMRSFPKNHPKREIYPHLVWIGHSKNIRVTGMNFLRSPSWSITLVDCERAVFDGLYIYSSLKEAVWADGIDLDGCRGVTIVNCHIETGDDCVALVSEDWHGPPRTCEQVTITNCHFSTASAGVKFSEGNIAGIRDIRVTRSWFNNVNRGFALNNALGGSISNVVFSDLTIYCNRFDWFWAGDGQPFRFRITRLSELTQEPPKPGEAAPGSIRNVTISNVVAYAKGSSIFLGHPDNWLDGISFEKVKLFLSSDPTAPFDTATNALEFHHARSIKLKDVEVVWETPTLDAWKSALYIENGANIVLDGFAARGAWPRSDAPAVSLKDVSGAVLRNCRALDGTEVFLSVSGSKSSKIRLETNYFSKAKSASQSGLDVPPGAVREAQ